jgi:DNA-binding transcriptional MerR regulator
VAEFLSEYEELMEADAEISQREVVERLNIPRSTLRHWEKRKNSIDEDRSVIRFFESPAGVAFLHRLILALHFVFT